MGAAAAFRDYLRDAEVRPFLAAMAGLFAVGIALRVVHLFDVIRLDEATTYVLFASRPFGEAVTSYQLPNNHLLNTVFIKLSIIAFGPEPWSMRLPNFLAGIGTMVLVAAIACRWFGRAGAVAALAAAAVALPLVHYSVQARGYTLMIFLCLFALWAVEKRLAGGGRGWTVVAALSSALALYAVPTGLLLVLPLAAYDFILSLKRGKRAVALWAAAWLAAGALTALLYLPVILHSGADKFFANEYNARLGPGGMYQYLRLYSRALQDEKTWAAGGAPLWAPLVAIAAVTAAIKIRRVGLLFALCALVFLAFFAARFPLPTRVLNYVATLAALAVGGLAGAAAVAISGARKWSKKAAWVGAAAVVALAAALGVVGETKNLINDSLRSGSARKARSVAAAMAELPPVTRMVVGGWYHYTVKYYLMLNGIPAEAIDRNLPQAFTFDAYVLVPPYSTPQKETDIYFWGGPVPVVRSYRAADVEGFGIWRAVIFNPR
jgi:4-amino-4-deoxy-L-arabinose transferase-like glycosyltransferase